MARLLQGRQGGLVVFFGRGVWSLGLSGSLSSERGGSEPSSELRVAVQGADGWTPCPPAECFTGGVYILLRAPVTLQQQGEINR